MNGLRQPTTLIWIGLLGFTLVCLALREQAGWLIIFPDAWILPITDVFNAFMTWMVDNTGWFFREFSALLELPMKVMREALNWLPWPVLLITLTVTAFALSGWQLAIFTFLSIVYMLVIGYWTESMNSLALVAVSVPTAVGIGFGIGTLGFFYPRARPSIMAGLDLLQTVPAFAYLLPILLLFGFGPVVGLIASVLYAFPPMVRNTILGLTEVQPEVIESGLMSGATGKQLFWYVRVPSALKQILLGINQTTMAAFSMVIIASIIGGTADIGWEVLSTMRKAQFGESLLAGMVITLMAMVMDRITAAFATAESTENIPNESFLYRHRFFAIALLGSLLFIVIAEFQPILRAYPEAWEIQPAEYLNTAVEYIILEHAKTIALIKSWAFFFLMLPFKVGLEQAISPYSWGFEFTFERKMIFAVAALAATLIVWFRSGANGGIALGFLFIVVFVGITNIPWPAFVAMTGFLAWQLAGPRLAVGTVLSLGFLLLSGVWPQTMLSLYLCGIAVALSFAIGTTLGILAAQFPIVSAILRPINDTLQTMPLFVILIPFVMIFKIGEFTALLAIMAYAIVPAIRYAEHGIRTISPEAAEAADSMGCTAWQLLWRVKVPLAMPVIMLGLNQTIMYGIAMLVIAALVGTNGLGQQVYIGLGDGDFGVGMVAGIGMAVIAMIADRMTQAWSKARQSAFGEVA